MKLFRKPVPPELPLQTGPVPLKVPEISMSPEQMAILHPAIGPNSDKIAGQPAQAVPATSTTPAVEGHPALTNELPVDLLDGL